MDFLVVRNLVKRYDQHIALDKLSLSIPSQSIFGLLGPNGAGKSSLIRIIAQIIKQDSGDIFINSETLGRKHMKMVGYLPEERGLYKKMEVGNLLLYLAQLKEIPKSEAKERIKKWLKKFDLLIWADSKVDKLSKGMQQKLQFIATVIHNPSLIILDEPFSGFDPVNVELVGREICQLREQGCTIIMSTHRMESVEMFCDRIGMIHKSRKVLEGTVDEVKNAFKKNKFEIQYSGNIKHEPSLFNILSHEKTEAGYSTMVVTLKDNLKSSELIQDLSQDVEIHLFKEVLPSMKDIFLEKVSA